MKHFKILLFFFIAGSLMLVFYLSNIDPKTRNGNDAGSDWGPGAPTPLETYTLSVSICSPGGGSVIPPGGVYVKDTSITLQAFPDPDFEVLYWAGDLTCEDGNICTITMNSDKNVEVYFALNACSQLKKMIQELQNTKKQLERELATIENNELFKQLIQSEKELAAAYRGLYLAQELAKDIPYLEVFLKILSAQVPKPLDEIDEILIKIAKLAADVEKAEERVREAKNKVNDIEKSLETLLHKRGDIIYELREINSKLPAVEAEFHARGCK